MTALLTVERNNTEKIGMLVSECRAMGLEVLPPDINRSELEFIIEDRPDQPPAIRFGLGAIKNVGEGPVEALLAARADGGDFTDLDDFCSRVDLRQVGRRPLECLMKVGALPVKFAPRHILLAIIDRMMNLSSSTHKAADAGQLSMFGLDSFEVARSGSILYPPPDAEPLPQKEMLAQEKELVGTYISEHPLQKHLAAIKASNATLLGELDETLHGHMVTVVGLVNSVRPHFTKKGEAMAFVEIEDIQAVREVLVFPRTYAAAKALLVPGNLIRIQGKVDAQNGGPPKILAETISTDLTTYQAADKKQPAPPPPGKPAATPSAPKPILPEPVSTPVLQTEPSALNPQPSALPALAEAVAAYQPAPVASPPPPPTTGQPRQIHLHITIPRTHNLTQDKHRLKMVYNLLTENSGSDRFSLYIPGGHKTSRIDFPNTTTKDSAHLRKRLIDMLGVGMVRDEVY